MKRTLFATMTGRVAVLAIALLALAAAASAAPVELLSDATTEAASLSRDQTRYLDRLLESPAVVDHQLVRLAVEPADVEGPVTLSLFPGETYELSTSAIERRSESDYTWVGSLPGVALQAILVVHGEHVTGSVVADDQYYGIRPLGDGLAAVVRIDPQGFPPEHPPSFDALEPAAPPASANPEACGFVDLIVAYTIDAGNAVADIYGLAQLAVAETNMSYSNSGVVHRVRMVAFYGTNYYDSGNMTTDRNRFRINGDGYMDEVHILRDAYRADVGVLITDVGYYCGIASAIYASSSTAFVVVAQNCATGYYSFGHEIGHLHGCRHNTQADPNTTPFAYGHGYYYQAGGWRTVMSYNCPGGCTRIPYWSNPNVTYGGVAMGTANTNDNHRVLNETCSYIAGFR
jgi:hypothetical protein